MPESAVEIAARLRDERAAIVRELASGTLALEALNADPRAAAVKAVVLAQSVPGVGKVRSRRVLDALGVVEHARWGDLTPLVVERLVAELRRAATDPDASPAGGR